MRYAYLKTNHAVKELERVSANPDNVPEGGPDAYVAHFVRLTAGNPGLVLSVHFQPEQDAYIRKGNVEAHSFYWCSRLLKRFGSIAEKPAGTIVRRLVVSMRIYWLLFRFRPTHILCWAHSFPLWAAYLAARSCRARFVYSRHNRIFGGNDPLYLRLTNAIDRWIIRHADAVVVHGPYLRDQLLQVGISADRLVEYNWGFRHLVEQSQGDHEVPDINKNGASRIVLYIGRIEETKGIFDLLRACANRLSADPHAKLVYVGDGTDLARLRSLVSELGLGRNVQLLGMVPHRLLGGVIRQSTIVVTPTQTSFPEGRCMATMEGLIMGVPVVAPDWGPFPYLVKHEYNGLLYNADSIADLRFSIERVLDDASLRARLRTGARESGARLCDVEVNFSQAVKTAFDIAGTSPRVGNKAS